MSCSGSGGGRRVTFCREPGAFVMSSDNIRPSTLAGIKSLARTLKKERGLKHMEALDVASVRAGFQNLKHAQKELANTGSSNSSPNPLSGYPLFLTCYWNDRRSGKSGRETLRIELPKPWAAIITPAQMKILPRGLAYFRNSGPDHLSRTAISDSQSNARGHVCAAARMMQFMAATGIRPSEAHSRVYPRGSSSNRIPGMDHPSVWYDPQSKCHLLADEPYEKAAESKREEREQWARQHGFAVIRPKWPGMYAPHHFNGGSRLYLIANETKGGVPQSILDALDSLPTPPNEFDWQGESAPEWPPFTSPGALAGDVSTRKKAKAGTTSGSKGARNSTGYVQTLVGPRRRPDGKMTIANHQRVGQLLKSVLIRSSYRTGVHKKLNAIRSELDEWVQQEYDRTQLSDDEFFGLYYQETGRTFPRTIDQDEREQHEESLNQAKAILVDQYPDCAPLRSLLKKMDATVSSLRKWRSE